MIVYDISPDIILSVISAVLYLVAFVISFVLAIREGSTKILWFIPTICFCVVIYTAILGKDLSLWNLLITAAMFFLNMWLANFDEIPYKNRDMVSVILITTMIVAGFYMFNSCDISSCLGRDEYDEIMSSYDWGDDYYYDSSDNQVKKKLW